METAALAEATPQPAAAASPLESFTGDLTAPKVSFLYKAGLAITAFAMVLLPASYVALIGLVGYGLVRHSIQNSDILQGEGSATGKVLLYFSPLLIGVILVFFMVKPFFARKPPPSETVSLSHEDEPLLFAFIGRICQLVGAPLPSRVDVDCQVNASACFREGLRSLFGRDVVLTIGLPLAAGLSMREFAGVLAHEFGHFTQGAGMRLSFLIRHVNHWFLRVVYERDEWDIQLEQASRQMDVRIRIVLYAARGCIWLTRRILWVLMMAGHGISCFLMRQMEYDADLYECKLAGSDAFVATVQKLQHLSVAAHQSYQDLRETWKNGQLPSDLPLFIQRKTAQISPELQAQLVQAREGRKTGAFDTHPADRDRVKAAVQSGEPGVFHRADPATGLFQNFAALSERITRFHYEHDLRLKVHDQNLVPVERVTT